MEMPNIVKMSGLPKITYKFMPFWFICICGYVYTCILRTWTNGIRIFHVEITEREREREREKTNNSDRDRDKGVFGVLSQHIGY